MHASGTTRRRLPAQLLAVALMAAAVAVGAAPVLIPGTRISMQMPTGFEIAEGFAGIIWRDAATSILVAELPTRASDMRNAMTPERLATRGMAMVEAQTVESAIGPATLVFATQMAQGSELVKMILVTGNDNETVLLTATAPAQVWPKISATVRATLVAATWDPSIVVDPMASLGYTVDATADLEPSRALAGAALLITARNPDDAPEKGGPYAVLARSALSGEPADLGVVARARLARTDRIGDVQVREEASASMAGMPAYELIATGRSSGRAVVLYQMMAFDGAQYYLLQGFVDAVHEQRYLPQFRALVASFAVRR